MGITSELRVLLVFIGTFIIIWKCASAQGIWRDGRRQFQEYNEGALMAHTIGSAGLNTQHYFRTLGIACENQAGSLYRIFHRYEKNCTAEVSSNLRRAYRGRFSQSSSSGSLSGFCDNWEDNRKCKKEYAKDLDACLKEPKGTEAFRFMDAYARYTCTSAREANSHVTDRPTKFYRFDPGVFKCFETLQEPILNCVKEKKGPLPFCSWFSIVEQCFSKFYKPDACNDPPTTSYIRNLFEGMSAELRCPLISDYRRSYDNDDSGWGWRPTTASPPIRGGWHEVRHPSTTEGWGWSPTTPSPPSFRGGWHEVRHPPSTTNRWSSSEKVKHEHVSHYDYYDTPQKQPHLRPWDDPNKDLFDLFGPIPTKIPDYRDRYTTTRRSSSSRRRYRENNGKSGESIRFQLPRARNTTRPAVILDDKLIYIPVSEDETNESFNGPSMKPPRDEISPTTPYYLRETSDETNNYVALGHRVSGRSTTFGPYSTIASVQFQVQMPDVESTTQRKRRFKKVRRSTTTTPGPQSVSEVVLLGTSKDEEAKVPPSAKIG